jgi:xylulokinase
LGLDAGLLPRVHESPEVTGALSARAAAELGLRAGVPVAGGAGDQAAGAVGNGIVRTGVVSAMIGTSGVVFAHADRLEADPQGRAHAFCHAVPGKWHTMGVMLAAGGSLAWFKRACCAEEVAAAARQKRDVYDLIAALAAKAAPGADGLYFLPYLTGERTPHADPHARACWLGIGPEHGKPEMARAVLEGIAYGLRDSLEIMKAMGVRPAQIRLSGGGSRSPVWRRMLTDIFGAPTCQTNSAAGSAYGALLLAGVAGGVWPSVEEACRATIKTTPELRPGAAAAKAYSARYAVFRECYPAIRPVFAKMAGVSGH